jgi:hypothetical protein
MLVSERKRSNCYDYITSQLCGFIKNTISEPWNAAKEIFKIYKKNKVPGIIITFCSLTIFTVLILIVTYLIKPFNSSFGSYNSEIDNLSRQTKHLSVGMYTEVNEKEGFSLPQTRTAKDFLSVYKKTVHLLKPILDGFVGHTSDVTGLTDTNAEGKIKFIDGTSIISSEWIYKKTLYFAVGLLTVLLVSLGVNFIINGEVVKIKDSIYRILLVSFMLVAGRFLMSISIRLVNASNAYFRKDASFTDYILEFVVAIENSISIDNNGIADNLKSLISISTGGIMGIIHSIPILLPLVLILLFLLFISFQFINRFVTLYFLVPLQPLAAVFALYPSTNNININFWRTWFTLLIHQPFFVLGYTVLQSILLDMLKTGPNIAGIVIFLSSLIFLSSINIIVSKIFGDVWVAAHQSLQAGAGLALLANGQSLTRNLMGKSMPSNVEDSNSNSQDQNTSEQSESKESTEPLQTQTNFDTPVVKALKNEGHSIDSLNESGELKVSGDFFAQSLGDGISALYSTKNEALENGADISSLRSVSLSNNPILDSSNTIGMQLYNHQIDRQLISKPDLDKVGPSHINTTKAASPRNIINSMLINRSNNENRNVQGIAVDTAYGKGEPYQKSLQIYMYDKDLNLQ